ncbi:MAG: diguanylate cyclase [Thermoleophilia bacterium]|nr:diguanylate cyclase [Thermoleophilia bacterium]
MTLRRASRSIFRRAPLLAVLVVLAVGGLIAGATDSLHTAANAEREVNRQREIQQTLGSFESQAWAAESISIRAYAEGGALPASALISFLSLATEIEAFFTTELASSDPPIHSLARQNLDNIEESREAVVRLRGSSPSSYSELLRGNLDISTRFFGGLNDRAEVSQERVEALLAARGRAQTNALIFGSAALVLLSALAGVSLMRLIQVRRRRLARLTTLAETDPLTGLSNRRGLDRNLSTAWKGAQAERPFTVMLLDLDDFKDVNDAFGHHAGDAVLSEAGKRVISALEEDECAGRFGGDEFLVVLPAEDGVARARAEQILEDISAEPFDTVGTITASAGIASYESGDSIEDVVGRADVALYRAKERRQPHAAQMPEVMTVQVRHGRENLRALGRIAARVDAQDPGGAGHSERVASHVRRLAIARGWEWTDAERLAEAALIHDLGKVAVPESLILKPGRLTPYEEDRMRQHPAIGARLAADALDEEQLLWMLHHHEWWSGDGYPYGLVKDDIPEGARLLAIADAWDAMRCERAYAAALGAAEALEECRRASGTQLWPVGVHLLEIMVRTDELAADAVPRGDLSIEVGTP